MFATTGQAHIFLATVYAGLVAGLCYDVFTLIRKSFKFGLSVTGVIDFLFWIIAAALLVIVNIISGGDGLRAYMLLGFFSGAVLYMAGIHAIIVHSLAGGTGRIKRKRDAACKEKEKKNSYKSHFYPLFFN